MEDFAGGEAEAGSPPSTAQMPSNERRQVRIALTPSRTVASTLVSCRPDAFERTTPGAHCPGAVPHRGLHSCQLPPS